MAPMSAPVDVVVVGGGAVGTATAWHLARRGCTTVLLERFPFGHANGSSGGPTRIFRFAYHTPGYVALAMRARPAWDELSEAAGEPLLRITGGIEVGGPARDRGALVSAAGARVEDLPASAIHERWPALRIPDGLPVVFSPDAGVIRATRTVMAQARLARGAGADLREGTAVTAVHTSADGVQVHTSAGDRLDAKVAVVTAGAWAGGLLATAGIRVPLQPRLEQSTYFDGVEALPTVVDWSEDEQHPPYLVPDPFEPGAFKVGHHAAGPPTDAEARTFDADPERVDRAERYVSSRVTGARPTGRTDTCLYTLTPDEDFVLDRVGPIVVASPCSGHGFKFVPLLGRVVADLALGQEPDVPLDTFGLDRAALRGA